MLMVQELPRRHPALRHRRACRTASSRAAPPGSGRRRSPSASPRRAGPRRHAHPRRARRRRVGDQRDQELDHEPRHRRLLRRVRRHRPRGRPLARHHGVRRRGRPTRVLGGQARAQARHPRLAHRAADLRGRPRPGGEPDRDGGEGQAAWGRSTTPVWVAAQGSASPRKATDVGAADAQERRQFGKPIASFQGIAFKLADMEIAAAGSLPCRCAPRYRPTWQVQRDGQAVLAPTRRWR